MKVSFDDFGKSPSVAPVGGASSAGLPMSLGIQGAAPAASLHGGGDVGFQQLSLLAALSGGNGNKSVQLSQIDALRLQSMVSAMNEQTVAAQKEKERKEMVETIMTV